jgi:hypothetical protein
MLAVSVFGQTLDSNSKFTKERTKKERTFTKANNYS